MNEPKTIEEWKTAYYRLEKIYTKLLMRHQGILNFLLNLWSEKSTRIFRVSTIATIITLLIEKEKTDV